MRILLPLTLTLSLALSGCSGSTDPCAGLSDTCVAATIRGNVGALDQLRITLDRPQLKAVLTPGTPHSLSLPVVTAIIPPAGTAGTTISVFIEGMKDGHAVANAGPPQPFVVPAAGQHAAVTFTLMSSGSFPNDLSGLGDGGPPNGDLAGPHLDVEMPVVNFPDTLRGQKSAPILVKLSNPTNTALQLDGNPMADGDALAFEIGGVAGTTCPQGMTTIAAGFSCLLGIDFLPTRAGPHTSTMNIKFFNAPAVPITMNGNGLRGWSDETIAGGPPNWLDVHGSGPNDIYAVGQASGSCVWHWNGVKWSNVTVAASIGDQNVYSVFALDPTHVWIGGSAQGPLAISFSANMGTNWNTNSLDVSGQSTGFIRKIFAASATDLYAVTDPPSNGLVLRTTNGSNWFSYSQALGGNAILAMGSVPGVLMVGGALSMVSFGNIGGAFGPPFLPMGVPNSPMGQVRGIWGDPKTNKFYFVVTIPGTSYIFSMTSGSTMATTELTTTMLLSNIGGRPAANGMPTDIFAVGALGNQVYHSGGNGTWQMMQLPTQQAMGAVYVDPSGDVVLAGFNGQIAHFR